MNHGAAQSIRELPGFASERKFVSRNVTITQSWYWCKTRHHLNRTPFFIQNLFTIFGPLKELPSVHRHYIDLKCMNGMPGCSWIKWKQRQWINFIARTRGAGAHPAAHPRSVGSEIMHIFVLYHHKIFFQALQQQKRSLSECVCVCVCVWDKNKQTNKHTNSCSKWGARTWHHGVES